MNEIESLLLELSHFVEGFLACDSGRLFLFSVERHSTILLQKGGQGVVREGYSGLYCWEMGINSREDGLVVLGLDEVHRVEVWRNSPSQDLFHKLAGDSG